LGFESLDFGGSRRGGTNFFLKIVVMTLVINDSTASFIICYAYID